MIDVTSLSPDLAVGGPPEGVDDLHVLAELRFLSVLNLRLPEEDGAFSSREEGIAASEAGLTHLNYPLGVDDLDEFHLTAFHTKLSLLPSPTYVHAMTMPLPATLALIDQARQSRWDADRTLDRARELNLPVTDGRWRTLLVDRV